MKRPHLYLVAPAISILLTAIFGFHAWLLLYTQLPRAGFVLVLVVELFLSVCIVWIAYAFIQTRLIRPLRMLEDQLKLLTHADADHEFDLPTQHYLDTLPDTARDFAQALVQERHQTARAIDSAAARVDQRTARLEAILHDLTEGVIVCTPDHQVVLFNQAADMLLRDSGTLSLHRKISSIFDGGQVEEKFDYLYRLYETESKREISGFKYSLADGGEVLSLRMNLIVETDSSCNGYVLSLTGDESLGDLLDLYDQSMLTDRPEFYDFSLFDRDTSLALSDRPLEEQIFVVFDTETTGLHPSKGDEIVQISGLRIVNNRILENEVFDCLVNPGFPIPKSSTRFHGITDDMVKNAPDAGEALRQFHTFAEGAVLVAHNAAFDMKFLKLKQEQSGAVFDHPVLDTLLLSFVLQPHHSAHTLDAIAARFGVDIPAGARHTALGDARSTADIFLRMLDALPHQDIKTLADAVHASNQVFEIRRLQEQF